MFDINYDTISPKISVKNTNVGGPSGGLMQTLSIFNKLCSRIPCQCPDRK